jgi:RNA polymerase sigma-70 factor (ECF subfamily)
LYRTYWEPLYAFIRRRGYPSHDAEDLTQSFFCLLQERDAFAHLAPEKGRFRSFLLAALRHFLADEHRRATALKRGGCQPGLTLDLEAAEQRCLQALAREGPPDALFDRQWAQALMDRAYQCVEAQYQAAGKAALFEALKPCLAQDGEPGSYASLAAVLGMTQAAVGMAVHRLRKSYRQHIRGQVAQTVSDPAEVKEELRYLLEVLAT